ncbi:MAG: regulatory protein RecX [Thermomonas sp.]
MTRSGGGDDDAASSSAPGRRRRPEPTPLQRALGLLTRREHSRNELVRKLKLRGVDVDEAAVAIDRLAEAGWQDDARFAESLVRNRAGSGYGPAYLRAELGTHGLAADLVEAALDAYDGDWTDNARQLLRRRHPQALDGDREARRKAADFLLRRGFGMDIVRVVLAGGD